MYYKVELTVVSVSYNRVFSRDRTRSKSGQHFGPLAREKQSRMPFPLRCLRIHQMANGHKNLTLHPTQTWMGLLPPTSLCFGGKLYAEQGVGTVCRSTPRLVEFAPNGHYCTRYRPRLVDAHRPHSTRCTRAQTLSSGDPDSSTNEEHPTCVYQRIRFR